MHTGRSRTEATRAGNPPHGAPPLPWHVLTENRVADRLGVSPNEGLGEDEAGRRLAVHGANAIPEPHRRGILRLLVDQFTDFMIVVLIVAAAVSGFIGDLGDSIAILVIVVLNGAIGFVQEVRAERAVAALRALAAPSACVRRGARLVQLPAAEVVPGDVVVLEAGNIVPADLRLIDVAHLTVEEASLTGESVPVDKTLQPQPELAAPLGDRCNMAYKGTRVTRGRAAGIAVATGMGTELGRIAALLQAKVDGRTPLQRRLELFGRRLALAALAICAAVFLMGLMRGEPLLLMFLTAVSLAVAAIPEALPAVVTVSLALAARRMVQQHVLIRRLPAVEALGSVSYICADKTGTLTENRMVVAALWTAPQGDGHGESRREAGEPSKSLYRALALSNDARPGPAGQWIGDPTEAALAEAAGRAGYEKGRLEEGFPRVAEFPFDALRRRMTTIHRDSEGFLVLTKGAPEALLPCCSETLTPSGPARFAGEEIVAEAERMAAHGLRVLAVASRERERLPTSPNPDDLERDLTFLGLVGLQDPPRPEVPAAIRECQAAGITPVMITGDHPSTAGAIGRRLGIIADDGEIVTGAELEAMPLRELEERVECVRIYARMAPEQKIKIVQALQDRGAFVAMTGDGVNDAPALRHADIGVAMGRHGTDVAREAADMVLLDDNFASIVAAVREGRRIFDNIRKFIKYTMTSNSGEIWTIFLAPLVGLPVPLLPIQILWVNLVTDGLPGLALAVEPREQGVMCRPPRPPEESIFAHGMWQHILLVGLLMGGVCLFTQAWAYGRPEAHWRTLVFTELTFLQMGHVLAVRSERQSLYRQGLLSNRPLLYAVALSVVLQLATIYVPFLNQVFVTAPLTWKELTVCLALSSLAFLAVEAEKAMVRRGWLIRQ